MSKVESQRPKIMLRATDLMLLTLDPQPLEKADRPKKVWPGFQMEFPGEAKKAALFDEPGAAG